MGSDSKTLIKQVFVRRTWTEEDKVCLCNIFLHFPFSFEMIAKITSTRQKGNWFGCYSSILTRFLSLCTALYAIAISKIAHSLSKSMSLYLCLLRLLLGFIRSFFSMKSNWTCSENNQSVEGTRSPELPKLTRSTGILSNCQILWPRATSTIRIPNTCTSSICTSREKKFIFSDPSSSLCAYMCLLKICVLAVAFSSFNLFTYVWAGWLPGCCVLVQTNCSTFDGPGMGTHSSPWCCWSSSVSWASTSYMSVP